ncbi:unnamed protein product [marine sediment metagenome]|uniref:Uncharacterized protein n=1 Tax=marine sediment metagenome TaxID=412755 RepID=X1LSJ8_9ZZZZ
MEIIGFPIITGINHNNIGKIPAIIKIDRTNFLSFSKSKTYANIVRAINPVSIRKK